MNKNRPLLYKQRFPIKFYPILPREKRVKMRREEKPSLTNNPLTYKRVIWSQRTALATGVKTMTYNFDATAVTGQSNFRTFQRNIGWKVLVAKGSDATFPYSRDICWVKPVQYSGPTVGGGYLSDSYGSVIGGLLVNQMDVTTLKDVAIGRLKNKLNGYIGNAQLAAPLAESREIHRLVRQVNGLGLDTVKALLAMKKTKGKSAIKLFSDVWLGFGFGVDPMLKDIEKAANAILDYTTREDRRVRVKGVANRDYHSASSTLVGGIAHGTDMKITSSAHHMQGVQIVAGIDLILRTAASYSVLDHLGLEISELPSTLWELVPFSWVADYAATVSPWLEDMFYTLPGTVKYVSQTTKYQLRTTMLPEAVNSPTFRWNGSMLPGEYKMVSIVRTKLATLPTRSLRIKTMDEIAQHSLTKLLNLASVLAGGRIRDLRRPNYPKRFKRSRPA